VTAADFIGAMLGLAIVLEMAGFESLPRH